MKKVFQKLISKLIKKSVSEMVTDPDVASSSEVVSSTKKDFWKFVIQTLISILTAILTALGATSCMGLH